MDEWPYKLKLNIGKTDFIVFRSKFTKTEVQIPIISVGGHHIKVSDRIRNLGAFFDNTLSWDYHVSKTCAAANMQLRNISYIRKFLDQKSAEILIHAFVSSKLDFCK